MPNEFETHLLGVEFRDARALQVRMASKPEGAIAESQADVAMMLHILRNLLAACSPPVRNEICRLACDAMEKPGA
jgi:hypothetical protein